MPVGGTGLVQFAWVGWPFVSTGPCSSWKKYSIIGLGAVKVSNDSANTYRIVTSLLLTSWTVVMYFSPLVSELNSSFGLGAEVVSNWSVVSGGSQPTSHLAICTDISLLLARAVYLATV